MIDIYGYFKKKTGSSFSVNTFLGEHTYLFGWKDGLSIEEIIRFETQTGCKLPNEYKDFLLTTNGASLFSIPEEDSGFVFYSCEEIIQRTEDLRNMGYELSPNIYVIAECMHSPNIILVDCNRAKGYLIDGDVGYPPVNWNHLRYGYREFFMHLFETSGAEFWRW